MAKKLTAFILLTIVCCLFSNLLSAQATHLLPPDQPEQDACNALSLCGSKFSTPYSYQGIGQKLDLTLTDNCGNAEVEDNSVWLKVQVSASGTIVFSIIPVDPLDDYDFAVADVTNSGCGNITQSNVVRYNFNNNEPGTNATGTVGISTAATIDYVCGGATGTPFVSAINAVAGETYLIMINNFGHDEPPTGPSKGFTIDFTGSTASFDQPPPPAFGSINPLVCNTSLLTLQVTKPVLCSSIAADGSDFSVSPSVAISKAVGVNCTGSTGYANEVSITLAAAPGGGTYTLNAKQGTDGNTLLGLCNSQLQLPDSLTFIEPAPITSVDSEFTCYTQLPYLWNGKTIATGGNNAATYTTKTAGGCDSTVVLNLTVSPAPATSSLAATICAGQLYTLPWNDSSVNTAGVYTHAYSSTAGCDSLTSTITVSIDNPSQNMQEVICNDSSKVLAIGQGFSNYTWGNGATTPTIAISQPGVYTVQATDGLGCIANDTISVSTDVITSAVAKNIPLCQGTELVITASPGFVAYVWSDGTTQPTLTITSGGVYWVTVTDSNHCQATDTATVVSVPVPVNFLAAGITKCFYSTITIQPYNSYNKYLWSTGDSTQAINVFTAGTYTLQVTDANGCVGTDSTNVQDSACAEYLYIPTAFTPNGDGVNDVFKPAFKGLATQYTFIVYNRWGQKVFASNNPANGWDGTINGNPQPSGVYVWFCQYLLYEQQPVTQKGTVVLIR